MIGKLILGGTALLLGARYIRNHPEQFDLTRFGLDGLGLGERHGSAQDDEDAARLHAADAVAMPATAPESSTAPSPAPSMVAWDVPQHLPTGLDRERTEA